MTTSPLPVWRSLLFVPVTARRFVDGAARRGADAIILDLEDSVAASEKVNYTVTTVTITETRITAPDGTVTETRKIESTTVTEQE